MPLNLPVIAGTALATYGAGRYLMRDKDKKSESPAAPAAPAAPRPSAAMQAKPRVRPASEGLPSAPAKSATRMEFEKEFLAARRRGDVEFTFRGKPYSSRRADETDDKHLERMKEAAAQQRLDDKLERYRARRGGA